MSVAAVELKPVVLLTEPGTTPAARRGLINLNDDLSSERLLTTRKRSWRHDKKTKGGLKRRSSTYDAPFNSTSFLIDDHSDTVQYLDESLGVHSDADPPKRFRLNVGGGGGLGNSSLGSDDDDDFYYSSPSDEEEFVNKEFLKDYNMVRTDCLRSMSKVDLINEYMQMEGRIDLLEKRLSAIREREETIKEHVDYDFAKGEIPMSPEIAEKIRVFQREIHNLELENIKLRHENEALLHEQRTSSSSSTTNTTQEEDGDSSSSSGSSDSSSSSSSSSDEDEEEEEDGKEEDCPRRPPLFLSDEDHSPDLISDNAVSSTSL